MSPPWRAASSVLKLIIEFYRASVVNLGGTPSPRPASPVEDAPRCGASFVR